MCFDYGNIIEKVVNHLVIVTVLRWNSVDLVFCDGRSNKTNYAMFPSMEKFQESFFLFRRKISFCYPANNACVEIYSCQC